MYYIGLDVHKKTMSYCVKDVSGRIQQEGKVGSTRRELDCWMKTLPQPWTVAMEATIFSGWIYDHLLPHAAQIRVAHPLMLRAIAAAKKKNDQIDASKIADCLRCDFLPECHMMPTELRDRRRTLRYRHLLVRQMVQMKNRVSGLLMETGVEYNKQRLHKVSYFRELLSANEEVHSSIRPLLKLSRETIACPGHPCFPLTSDLHGSRQSGCNHCPLACTKNGAIKTICGSRFTYTITLGPTRCDPVEHPLHMQLKIKQLRYLHHPNGGFVVWTIPLPFTTWDLDTARLVSAPPGSASTGRD
jgi:hypothetical protein